MSMKFFLTPEQVQILIDSMRSHIGRLQNMAESYRANGNLVALEDCLDEKTKVQSLLNMFMRK